MSPALRYPAALSTLTRLFYFLLRLLERARDDKVKVALLLGSAHVAASIRPMVQAYRTAHPDLLSISTLRFHPCLWANPRGNETMLNQGLAEIALMGPGGTNAVDGDEDFYPELRHLLTACFHNSINGERVNFWGTGSGEERQGPLPPDVLEAAVPLGWTSQIAPDGAGGEQGLYSLPDSDPKHPLQLKLRKDIKLDPEEAAETNEAESREFCFTRNLMPNNSQTYGARAAEYLNEVYYEKKGLQAGEGQSKSARTVEFMNEVYYEKKGLQAREGQSKSACVKMHRNEVYYEKKGLQAREGQSKSACVKMHWKKLHAIKKVKKLMEKVRVQSELARKHLQLTPHELTAQGDFDNLVAFDKIPEAVIMSMHIDNVKKALKSRSVTYRLNLADLKARLIAYQKDPFDVVIKHGKNLDIKCAAELLQQLEGNKGEGGVGGDGGDDVGGGDVVVKEEELEEMVEEVVVGVKRKAEEETKPRGMKKK